MKRLPSRHRGVHLECLEGRTLLSTAAVPHPPVHVAAVSAAAPKVVTIGGQVNGTASPYANPKLPLYNTLLSAKGTAAGLAGQVLMGGYDTSSYKGLTASLANGKASFAFTSAPGTYLNISFGGSGPINAQKATATLTVTGTITGGGGVFAGVKGTFSGTVTANGLNNGFVLKYTFKITPAH